MLICRLALSSTLFLSLYLYLSYHTALYQLAFNFPTAALILRRD